MASIGSDGLIAAWAAVFAALSVLYAHERTRGLARNFVTRHAVQQRKRASDAAVARRLIVLRAALPSGARGSAVTPAVASSHPLFASPGKAKSGGKRPVRSAAGKRRGGQAKARERATPAREKIGLGATQPGEEAFSVADAAPGEPPAAPLASAAQAAPSEASFVSTPASAAAAADPPDYVRLCATFRSQGRFAEAARLARDGLAVAGDPSLLLVELSRAELGLGRVNAAIDTARDAHFASHSRESVEHLIWLLTETRRFARDDGPSLRRAVSRHPCQPLLLHAAGVFEAMYGEPAVAGKWLRAALALAPDEAARSAISGELARVEESRARNA